MSDKRLISLMESLLKQSIRDYEKDGFKHDMGIGIAIGKIGVLEFLLKKSGQDCGEYDFQAIKKN